MSYAVSVIMSLFFVLEAGQAHGLPRSHSCSFLVSIRVHSCLQEDFPVCDPVMVAQKERHGHLARGRRFARELEPGFFRRAVGLPAVDATIGEHAVVPGRVAAA